MQFLSPFAVFVVGGGGGGCIVCCAFVFLELNFVYLCFIPFFAFISCTEFDANCNGKIKIKPCKKTRTALKRSNNLIFIETVRFIGANYFICVIWYLV